MTREIAKASLTGTHDGLTYAKVTRLIDLIYDSFEAQLKGMQNAILDQDGFDEDDLKCIEDHFDKEIDAEREDMAKEMLATIIMGARFIHEGLTGEYTDKKRVEIVQVGADIIDEGLCMLDFDEIEEADDAIDEFLANRLKELKKQNKENDARNH